MKKRQPPKKEDQRPDSADSNPRDLFPDTFPLGNCRPFPIPAASRKLHCSRWSQARPVNRASSNRGDWLRMSVF